MIRRKGRSEEMVRSYKHLALGEEASPEGGGGKAVEGAKHTSHEKKLSSSIVEGVVEGGRGRAVPSDEESCRL